VLRSLALTAGFAAVVRLASALVGEVAPALPIVSRGPTKEWLVRREDEMDRWRIWAVPLLAAGALAWVGMLWPSADLIGRLVWVPYAFFLGSLGASSLLRRRGHAPSTARLLQSLAGPWGAAVALIQKPRCAWCGTPRPQPPCANCGYDGQ
jgi:hypothetical protein